MFSPAADSFPFDLLECLAHVYGDGLYSECEVVFRFFNGVLFLLCDSSWKVLKLLAVPSFSAIAYVCEFLYLAFVTTRTPIV